MFVCLLTEVTDNLYHIVSIQSHLKNRRSYYKNHLLNLIEDPNFHKTATEFNEKTEGSNHLERSLFLNK